MKYVLLAFDYLFGCHHNNLSRVFTIAGRTYCVCCECGKEFAYSFRTMSVGSASSICAPRSTALKSRFANGS